jgi:hypothetical protein
MLSLTNKIQGDYVDGFAVHVARTVCGGSITHQNKLTGPKASREEAFYGLCTLFEQRINRLDSMSLDRW